ncbi:non-ribosomal peptide synthetase [Nocardia arthritidis]|nr:non-ribosomal peptide synthetase [Nocardia arthritidis]
MTPEQRELMRRILDRRFSAARRLPTRERGTRVPLTPSQAGIWFFTQLYPDSAEYNVFDLLGVPMVLGAADLRRALASMVERHDALRLYITLEDGKPYQYDRPPFEPQVGWHDLRDLPDAEAIRRAEDIANGCAQTLLPVDGSPLFCASGIAMPGNRTLVVLVLHHLVTDYVSFTVLIEELSALLAGGSLTPAPEAGFLDYAAWLDRTTDPGRVAAELVYWTNKLTGDLPVLDMPSDRARPERSSRRGHAVAFALVPETVAALRRLAAEEETTLFTVVLAAYKVLLMRLGGQRDVIVGTALAGRDHPDAERIVGCFIKSLPLRTYIDPATTFRKLVRAVHTTVVEAQDHQTVPFAQIVAALGAPHGIGVHPVFQAEFGLVALDGLQLSGAEINPITLLDYNQAKWDISVTLWDSAQRVSGTMECSADLFDQPTVARFCEIYQHLCGLLAAQPNLAVGRHPLVSDAERHRILHEFDGRRSVTIAQATLAELFEAQVRRTPDAVAVEQGERTLAYREFNARANQAAWALRELGVRRGAPVALLMQRSMDMLVAIYAVTKSGGVYVPLDPELPDLRLAHMLEDTAPEITIIDRRREVRVPGRALPYAELMELSATMSAHDPVNKGSGGNLSHLLYTSGSTGKPKAVACPVETAVADILYMQRQLKYQTDDAILFKTSYGFDTSLWEIFWPLYVGARIVVCPPGAERDPAGLIEQIEKHSVTVVDLTPTVLRAVLDLLEPGRCPSLRYLHTGGEMVTADLRDDFCSRSGAELVNGYGPTETGCAVTAILKASPDNPTVPLGRPHPHFRLYVLDEALNMMPIGIPGEAYLSAEVGIAHGYFQRPRLTAERFLPDPYGPPGRRMYRTGDLCKYMADGTVTIRGRVDSQIKVRGLRVELEEIESVLRGAPGVSECAVIPVGADMALALAAFVVMEFGETLDVGGVRGYLAQRLPRHMVPAGVQIVDNLPVNVNGKIDRQALLGLWREDTIQTNSALVAPTDELERQLAEVFGAALGLSHVGVTDSFFDLGGHSLLVFRLIAACQRQLGIKPQVQDVFAAPTVRELADLLRTQGPDPQRSLVALGPRPGRPLVVFVHGSDGSALPFHNVARHLGREYSVHAVRAVDGETYADTIEELAAQYLTEIDKIRGLSPVCLAGWSVGGCIALEMARQWRLRGIKVPAVLMLDAWPPLAVNATAAARESVREAIHTTRIPTVDAEEKGRLTRIDERHRHALLEYRPAPYDGEIILLRAADQTDRLQEIDSVPDYGWGRVIDRVVVRPIPGSHYTLLEPEHALSLAAVIRDLVDERISFAEL